MRLSLLSQMKTVSYRIYDVVRACVSTFGREYSKRRNYHARAQNMQVCRSTRDTCTLLTLLCQIQLDSFHLKLL